MIKITSGILKGLELNFPVAEGLRPTTPRIRESIFNSIQPDLQGSCFLDVFCGSGAIALTALSRGARRVIALESEPSTCRYLSSVIAKARDRLKKQDQVGSFAVELYSGPARISLGGLIRSRDRFDFIYLDPPFKSSLTLLTELGPQLFEVSNPNCRLILEIPAEIAIKVEELFHQEGQFCLSKSLDYKRRVVLFFDRSPNSPAK